jgi:hypothetical protein
MIIMREKTEAPSVWLEGRGPLVGWSDGRGGFTTPVNSEDEDEMTEDQKRYLASAKRRASRAGGQGTATSPGETDTRVARRHPSKT